MHLAAPDQGHMLSSGVVATQIPVAVGAAFANLQLRHRSHRRGVLRRRRGRCRRVLGEHQRRRPVPAAGDVRLRGQRLCGRHAARGAAGGDVRSAEAVKPFGADTYEDDSGDVESVYSLAKQAAEKAHRDRRPAFLNIKCCRYPRACRHRHRTGTGAIATEATVERDWISRDAVKMQRARLASHQVSESAIAAIEEEIDKAIQRERASGLRKRRSPRRTGSMQVCFMRKLDYSGAIREAMTQEMERDPRVFVYGIGVPTWSKIFNTTRGLVEKFGSGALLRHADLGGRDDGLRPRRRHPRPAADPRPHPRRLHDPGDQPAPQHGVELHLFDGRQAQGAAGGARRDRPRLGAGSAALEEPVLELHPHSRAEGYRADDAVAT